ncbi:hypothetical protein Hanom_Chr11g01022761 [Helianthus anomalus]
MGVRPLEAGEVYWYEQIKANFLYPPGGAFSNPLIATKGAHLPKPRPLRGVTSAGKEILYLSSEESVGSSHEELSSWSNIFAGVLCDLGKDSEEKPKKAPTKKKRTTRKKLIVETGVTSKKAGGSRTIPEKGEKKKRCATASKSSGSAGSRAPESGANPSSLHVEEEEKEGVKLVTRKRSREDTTAGMTPLTQQAAATQPIGRQGRLRSLYKFSPGWCLSFEFFVFYLGKISHIFPSAEELKKATEKAKGSELKKAKVPELKMTKFVYPSEDN